MTRDEADALCVALSELVHAEPYGRLWDLFDKIRMDIAT